MNLSTRITLLVVLAMSVIGGVVMYVESQIIHKLAVENSLTSLRVALSEAEDMRSRISLLREQGAFDNTRLLADYKASKDVRKTTLYQTIPIVAAWKAIENSAQKNGWEFRVSKHQARNKENLPTPEEEKIFKYFDETKNPEYVAVEEANDLVVLARPIFLTKDCLSCHGDPKTSPTGDGKDIVGFQMENWKAGERHGMFVLKSSLSNAREIARKGIFTASLWILPIALSVCGLAIWLTRRGIVRPMQDAIGSITLASEQQEAASTEISNAAQSLAAGSSTQAASIGECRQALDELNQRLGSNYDASCQAASKIAEAKAMADNGKARMQEMQVVMNEVKGASQNIATILKTIDEIAFQTNILALNAAVEAARAGEAGAGFSVVAEEVRALAHRCAAAAKDSAQIIQTSVSKSGEGFEVSQRLAMAWSEVQERVTDVDGLVKAIASDAGVQKEMTAKIAQSVTQLDELTHNSAAAAQESAAAAEQLNAQAHELRFTIERLQAVIAGAKLASSKPSGPAATQLGVPEG